MAILGKTPRKQALDLSRIDYTGSDITGPYALPKLGTEESFDVWVGGVFQSPAAYSVSGSNLIFSEAVPTGLSIIIKARPGRLRTRVPAAGTITGTELSDGEFPVEKIEDSTPGNVLQYVGGAPTSVDPGTLSSALDRTRIFINSWRIAANSGQTVYQMVDGISDDYQDESGIDTVTSTNETWNALGYYTNGVGSDMTLVSDTFTALAVPSETYIALRYEDVSTTAVLGTDFVVELSRDSGTSWSTVSVTDEGLITVGETSKKILTGTADLSAQPSGTGMRYRITTNNLKEQRVYSAALQWR